MVHYRARRRPQGIPFHEIMTTGHPSWGRTRITKDEIIMLHKKTVVAGSSTLHRVGWNEEIYKKPLRRRGDRIRKRKTDNQQTVAAPVGTCSNLQYTANQNLLYRSFRSLFFSFSGHLRYLKPRKQMSVSDVAARRLTPTFCFHSSSPGKISRQTVP